MSIRKIIFSEVNGNRVVSFGGSLTNVYVPAFNGVHLEMYGDEGEEEEDRIIETPEETFDILFHGVGQTGDVMLDPGIRTLPTLDYSDVTEKLLLSGAEIKKGSLQSADNGILAGTGIRKIRGFLNGSLNNGDLPSKSHAAIKVQTVNGETSPIAFKEFLGTLKIEKKSSGEIVGYSMLFSLDTDELAKAFVDTNAKKEHLTFDCSVQVHFGEEVELVFPMKFVLVNTDPSVCKFISPKPASVDFGTSSTCVATWQEQGPELLTLSPVDTEENVNPYENPTNLMIYNWDAIREAWLQENGVAPVFNKGNKRSFNQWNKDKSNRPVHFDFGYSVKEELGDAKDTKILNSIVSLIKMLPYQILEKERQYECVPFGDEKEFVEIVCNPEEQNEKKLDPVAIYGYLIGRAVNDVSKHQCIHTKFQITCPVKFSDKVKDSLRRSLKWGLSKSVPRPLADLVEVTMDRSEPEAYIGAVCGTEYLKINEGETKSFAVFDFGGGTLDFSYGTVTSEDDELSIATKMSFGINGIGGECLIERLSYEIYCANINAMVDNRIPIEKPDDSRQPDKLTDELIKPSVYTRSNMNSISARISRRIFEGQDMGDARNENISLYDENGVQQDIEVSYDLDELDALLREVIKNAVNSFATEMDNAFASDANYSRSNIHIFLAGNSSKNAHVYSLMRKTFPDSMIVLVDQIADGKVEEKRYAITPKTAVAIGQLNLNNFASTTDQSSFKLHVGFFNLGNGTFKEILKMGEQSKEWKQFKKIRNGKVDVFYSNCLPAEGSMNRTASKTLTISEADGKYLFIRMKDQLVLEYCVGESVDALSDKVFELSFIK